MPLPAATDGVCRIVEQLMTDILDPEARSARMGAVRQQHTTPELAVRKAAHAAGLRFRLHRRNLPGTPDLVFPKHQTVVFVHGCFWHRHEGCRKSTMPKSRTDFWSQKFDQNRERDAQNIAKLTALGWRVVVIWECQTRDPAKLAVALARAFSDDVIKRGCGQGNVSPEVPTPTQMLDAGC